MQLPSYIIDCIKQIQQAGFEAYIVGGAVRDYLLNRPFHDIDLTTSAFPEQIKNIFPKVYDSGIKHGTVTVLLDEPVEITTYRGEGNYSDGRHPDEVFFVKSIEEDLARRDFTMNAIAFNPVQNIFADPFSGIQDIENKTIKAVRNPEERFSEDGLRPMRAIRFESTLGFCIESNTCSAIKNSIDTFKKVSIERIQSELMKILSSEKPSKGLQTLLDVGFLKHILPEILPMVRCSQNKYHEYDVWKHTLYTVDFVKNTPMLRLAALFHDIAKPCTKGIHPKTGEGTFYNHEDVGYTMTQQIMERLKFSNEEIKIVSELVLNHFIEAAVPGPGAGVALERRPGPGMDHPARGGRTVFLLRRPCARLSRGADGAAPPLCGARAAVSARDD